jgi:hypothetical protein
MAVILNGSLSSADWTVEPGVCVKSSEEQRLLDAGSAREMTDADKPEKAFNLDSGTWEVFKAEKKK